MVKVKYKQPPKNVKTAMLCGPKVRLRNWQDLPVEKLTRAERVMMFCTTYMRVPEGELVGKPIHLEPFQQSFFYAVFDNKHKTRRAILSIARKNSKTVTCAMILLAYICGPEAKTNSMVCSGAMGRDQAALVFNHMVKFIQLSPELSEVTKIIPSQKKIIGLHRNVEYQALAKDGGRAVGRSDQVILGDEWGQINAETDPFVDALTTSQGAHGDDALQIVISTQAPSDAAMLSQWIDDAHRSQDPKIVCHLYCADPDCDLLDEKQWAKANPAMGKFRSKSDLAEQLKQAERLPSQEASSRNLLLNQRVSLDQLFLSASVWKRCGHAIDEDVFQHYPVIMGLDLSMRLDLTAAVICAIDDNGIFHIKCFTYTPSNGVEDRAKKDRNPYARWIKEGHLIAVSGDTVSYEQVSKHLQSVTGGMLIEKIYFDRWRIDDFKDAAEKSGFGGYSEWIPFGQGFKDMSPALDNFEELAISSRLRHGNCPLLTLGASSAISTSDPSLNRKISRDKCVAGGKTDPLIAALMAVHGSYVKFHEPEAESPLLVF